MGHVIHKIKFGVKVKVKRSLLLHMHILEIFLTEMESFGNFLQNDTKFVQIPLVIAEILQCEIRRVPFFLQKPQFLKGRISKTTAPISIKLKILAFIQTLPANQS